MSHDRLTYEDLLQIVELIKTSEQFSEFRLKIGEIEVELRRRDKATAGPLTTTPSILATSACVDNEPGPVVAPAPLASNAVRPGPPGRSWPEGSIIIRSPMVGTFYRSPEPGAPPFVVVGQTVEPDTTVCIIEVMKLMNSIPAGTLGRVIDIVVDDAAPVESGQSLIVLAPESSAP
ncbi:MAG TPA: acetyl-CoA carboxylase biotin carboxyl carrier protein [Candidatus Binatus sp.]|nr:acetyl-CoA carboxylase biotin carboxyl carrier protein [Candidatus Binatus sp.]